MAVAGAYRCRACSVVGRGDGAEVTTDVDRNEIPMDERYHRTQKESRHAGEAGDLSPWEDDFVNWRNRSAYMVFSSAS